VTTRFRTSFTHTSAADPALLLVGRIVGINLVNWTVDVVTQFDRKRFFEIQVGGPYLHYAAGEGIYAFPEMGAICTVCIPSDSSPPFVQSFLMPHEIVTDAPAAARSRSEVPRDATDATFAGGRTRAKPGDIVLRGRDGQFVVLHRGGVLQIGASELAQRLFLPLGNLMVDMSERYAHHNAGGAILWGLQEGASDKTLETAYVHTFRVFASDRQADVRVSVGKVPHPMPDPDGGVAASEAEVGEKEPVVVEVAVSPRGFDTDTGRLDAPDAAKKSVFRFVLDRAGNTLLRAEGHVALRLGKKLTVHAKEDVSLSSDASARVKAAKGLELDGGTHAHLRGGLVRLGAGASPVARLGDLVTVPVAAIPVVLLFSSPPIPGTPAAAVLTVGAPGAPVALIGNITSGNAQVLG
jgi:hypothetical protein